MIVVSDLLYEASKTQYLHGAYLIFVMYASLTFSKNGLFSPWNLITKVPSKYFATSKPVSPFCVATQASCMTAAPARGSVKIEEVDA